MVRQPVYYVGLRHNPHTERQQPVRLIRCINAPQDAAQHPQKQIRLAVGYFEGAVQVKNCHKNFRSDPSLILFSFDAACAFFRCCCCCCCPPRPPTGGQGMPALQAPRRLSEGPPPCTGQDTTPHIHKTNGINANSCPETKAQPLLSPVHAHVRS
jgi:hypothetical protein